MSNRKFLLGVIQKIEKDKKSSNWRGTLTSWIKC